MEINFVVDYIASTVKKVTPLRHMTVDRNWIYKTDSEALVLK